VFNNRFPKMFTMLRFVTPNLWLTIILNHEYLTFQNSDEHFLRGCVESGANSKTYLEKLVVSQLIRNSSTFIELLA
jgi:hypothetical protein